MAIKQEEEQELFIWVDESTDLKGKFAIELPDTEGDETYYAGTWTEVIGFIMGYCEKNPAKIEISAHLFTRFALPTGGTETQEYLKGLREGQTSRKSIFKV